MKKTQATLLKKQAEREDRASKLSEQDMTRQQQMIARNAISRADYDKAVSGVKSAQAQIATSDAQIRAPIDGTVLATVVQEGQTVNAV